MGQKGTCPGKELNMLSHIEKYNLMYTLSMTSTALKDGLHKEFLRNGYDITTSNFAILFRLWQQDNLAQHQLCELTCKNKSNLTRILDAMVKKDMVIRNLNPDDRRSYTISLTDYSRSLQMSIIKIALEYSNKIFNQIEDDEIEVMRRVFAKINGVL